MPRRPRKKQKPFFKEDDQGPILNLDDEERHDGEKSKIGNFKLNLHLKLKRIITKVILPLCKKAFDFLVTLTKPIKKGAPKPTQNPGDSFETDPNYLDIKEYLQSIDKKPKRCPSPCYLDTIQTDITLQMRCVEIEQLVDIVERLNFGSDTLYRTVSYLDRFLSKVSVIPDNLQFVCLSCMLIASKYEERDGADVEDVCYLTFYSYTEEQVVKMEAKILKTLKYKMGKPTIMTFLELFIAVAKENCEKFKFLSCYLAELSLFDDCCIKYLPSRIAASVMFVAKLTLRPKVHPWSVILEKCTGYEVSELKDCVLLIHDLQLSRRGYSTDFVRKKYQQPELKNVANLMFPDKLLTLYFKDVKK